MPYRLYNRIGSGGLVVEAALALAGAEFELIDLESEVSTPLPEDFLQINPWRQIPTLILPDGTVMTETAAILAHLAACFPDKDLAPAPGSSEHATFLRWISFASANLYEAVLRRVYPFRFTTDPAAIDGVKAAAISRMGAALLVLEEAIEPGPFLPGTKMSLADPYVAMLFSWYTGDIDAPRLTALTEAVRQHPTVAPIWQRHFG